MQKNEKISKLQEIILNTRTPIVLKHFNPSWKCCNGKIEDWCKHFNDKEIEFEEMSQSSDTGHPQWEREREKVSMTMNDYLKKYQTEKVHSWGGLNYQTPDDIPVECRSGVDFGNFGFPHLTEDYARFWLSSKGANTPCHQDTYGCNIVVQVFGSKSWLLFPPHTPLTTTRIPYEESSIYCLENFFAPSPAQVAELRRFSEYAYSCRLEAGDVLIVPRHWWHFVEAEALSLSINAWIPLDIDISAQLEECVVKYLIETIAKQEEESERNYILNPNQRDLCAADSILEILSFLTEKINSSEYDKESKTKTMSYAYQYLDDTEVRALLNVFPNGFFVEKLTTAEYEALVLRNSKRFVRNEETKEESLNSIKYALINSVCSGNVVKRIVEEFHERIKFNHKM